MEHTHTFSADHVYRVTIHGTGATVSLSVFDTVYSDNSGSLTVKILKDVTLADGLVAYYPFNGNANDGSGCGKHGVVHGATLTKDRFGVSSCAFLFGGTDYIDLPDRPIRGVQSSFTVCCWLYPTDETGGYLFSHSGNYREIDLIFGVGAGPATPGWDVYADQKGHCITGTAVPLNAWIHMAGTYDGVDQRLYVNGVPVAQYNWPGSVDWDADFWAEGIGGNSYEPHAERRFHGKIDELRIYNRALSADEIATLYGLEEHSVSTPATPSGLSTGTVGQALTFTTGDSVCTSNHPVEYRFDWDDGSTSVWSTVSSASHAWSAVGTFSVCAQARCGTETSIESAWSGGKAVVISAPAQLVLTVSNPGDGKSLKLTWTGSGGNACSVTRTNPDGSGTTLASRTFGTNIVDGSVSRGQTYVYRVAKRGTDQVSNLATGKAEHVVVLVRGIHKPIGDDSSTYWSNLRGDLKADGFTVWDACYDDAANSGDLITGFENYSGAAEKLDRYIVAKMNTYASSPEPKPDKIDMVAHSLGGLTARQYLGNRGGFALVRRLITLSGAHCGSPVADYKELLLNRLFGPVFSPLAEAWLDAAYPAIDSLRPAYVEAHPPSPFSGTETYLAGGTTCLTNWPVPGILITETNDGWVPLTSAYGKETKGRVRITVTWSPTMSVTVEYYTEEITHVHAVERTPFAYDHTDIAGNKADVVSWIRGILTGSGTSGGGAGGNGMPVSLRGPIALDGGTAVTNADQLVVTTNDAAMASATNVHAFVVDACEYLETWSFATNSMIVALRRPDGSVIDSHTGDTDSNVTYTAYGDESKVSYRVQAPATGVWQVLVAPSNGVDSVDYDVQATVFNAVGLQFFCSPSWTVTGDTVIVGCTFGAATQEVQSATVTARVFLETNEVLAATLYDDGQHYDAGTNDGLFACAWSNVPLTGIFNVRYDVAGVRTNGNPFTRVGFSDLAVSPVKAVFTGAFASWGSDTNADGAFDTLSTDIGVEIQTDGVYTISGTLLAGDGTELDSTLCPTQALAAGVTTNLALVFSGTRIEAAGKDGPYTLGPVYALDVAECYERVGVSGTYTTALYLASSFAAKDSDGDRVSDAVEAALGTNPDLADTDGDGSPDYEELSRDGNPTNYTAGVDTDPVNVDTDGDGMWDGEEATAGTSPLSKDDFFAVREVRIETNTAVVVSWDTQTGRTYTVYASTNLPSTNQVSEWSSVYQTSGDGGRQSYTNADATLTNRFFRVGVQRP